MKYSYESVLVNYELMRKCFPLESKPQKFFHYTSQESFYAMFKDYIEQLDMAPFTEEDTKYVNLFASQMQYLNDKQEYREGVQVIKDAGVDTAQLFESIFVTCFCGKEDLLSQWKYYGKNCGIAIEFDFSDSTQLCWYTLIKSKTIGETPPPVYWANIIPYNVFYENHKDQFLKMKEIVNSNSFKDTNDKEAANIFIPYCKNANFLEEDESRIVFYPVEAVIPEGERLITKIEYRAANGKIVPQFKCKIAYLNNKKSRFAIPVKSIMIGPGNNQRLIFNSIINMLERDKSNIRFYSDEDIDPILNQKGELTDNDYNKLGLLNNRVTYRTTDNILISMSRIPFRD